MEREKPGYSHPYVMILTVSSFMVFAAEVSATIEPIKNVQKLG